MSSTTSVLVRRLLALLAASGAVLGAHLALAPPASAHDQLVSTFPADGSSGPAPRAVRVTFSEPLLQVGQANQLVVTGPGGVVDGALSVDGAVLTQSFEAPLRPGRYRVQWRAASSDGHPVSGTFAFTAVAAKTLDSGGGSTATAGMASTSPSAASPSAAPSTTPTSAQGGAGWGGWFLAALAAVALASTALIVVARRQAGRGGTSGEPHDQPGDEGPGGPDDRSHP